MGFYGNITNTAKTTFSFDLIYDSRTAMDAAISSGKSDGVFLGRYVLVDYDTDVIEAYYLSNPKYNSSSTEWNEKNQYLFYNVANVNASVPPIQGQPGVIYKPINKVTLVNGNLIVETNKDQGNTIFFIWDEKQQCYTPTDGNTPYAARFNEDVRNYGRGYDSTVWTKVYDADAAKYKYVLIAELNSAVPTFHLMTEPPTPLPTTPYFDRDTTNLDYYLHSSSNYGHRIGMIKQGAFTQDSNGEYILSADATTKKYEGTNTDRKSDVQLNRWGVNYTTDNTGYQIFNNIIEKNVDADIYYNKIGFDPAVHTYVDNINNEIGYELTTSGRYYSNNQMAPDTLDWFFRLPILGNAVCEMWDRIYGTHTKSKKRFLNFAQKKDDTSVNLVSYDQDTMIGIVNTVRDMLGYYYVPLSELGKTEDSTVGSTAPTMMVTHKIAYSKGGIQDTDIEYPILQCLYYDDNGNYYHYAYTPEYTPYDNSLPLKDDVTYYYKVSNNVYRVANPEARDYENANHDPVTLQFYTKVDGWKLKKIIPNDTFENSIYGLIAEIHKLLGTNVGDTRDYGSIQGSINIIKDIVESLELKPDRLVCTNEKGQLTTYDKTYFPSATWDRDEVLNGNGEWVSRFATVSVLENSINDHQNTSKVNNAESGTEAGKNIIVIKSDNNKDENGNSPTNPKELHSPNNLTLGTRNKWIQLHADDRDDSIEFRHLESPIIGRLRAEQAVGTTENTLPIDVNNGVDKNGNVILKTKTELAKKNADFDNFSVNEKATEITVKPTTDNLEYKSNESDQNDNRLTIPYLTVDNAGHVVELGTKNFNIPHGFKKIKTTIIEDTDESDSSDKSGISIAESISDTLELAPQNRWIDIATEVDNNEEGSAKDNSIEDPKADKITFGHRLVPTLKENVTLNGDRRTSEDVIPHVYRYGLPQDKSVSDLDEKFGGYDKNGNKIIDNTLMQEAANTFNVPYIEVDMAGHVVAAETHTVELPENFTTIKVLESSTNTTDSDADQISTATSLEADTLQDTLILSTKNRWVGIGIDANNDGLTFGHKLVPSLNDTVTLNGDPRITKDAHGYEQIHRYGLPQDKSISDLDKDFGGYKIINGTPEKITETKLMHEQANTFNVPYIEVDNAGHIVAAETHTVKVPHGYAKMSTGKVINDEAEQGQAGHTIDELAGNEISVSADTLEEEVIYAPSNKWIRINATNTEGTDTVTFGHEIHDIVDTEPDPENLDSKEPGDKTFTTQVVNWDTAGHIIEHGTITWTLPNSIRNITIQQPSNEPGNLAWTTKQDNDGNTLTSLTLEADTISDTISFIPANKWIRLMTENNDIKFAHLVQEIDTTPSATETIAASGKFITYELDWDQAGHIISKTSKTFTLPNNYQTITVSVPPEGLGLIELIELQSTKPSDQILFVGDQWIKLLPQKASQEENKPTNSIAFTHLRQDKQGSYTYDEKDVTVTSTIKPSFGDCVQLYGYTTDAAGHITDNPLYAIQLPQGKYTHETNNADDSHVFVGMTFDASSGSITTSSKALGEIKLGVEATDENSVVQDNDTLYTILNGLEGKINVNTTSISSLLEDAALTGTPTAPTADNTIQTTQVATTEYVHNVMAAMLKSFDISLRDFIVTASENNGSFMITIPEYEIHSALEKYTYQWQQSSNKAYWIDINGATNNTYTPTEPNFYRCRVTKTCCGLTKIVSSEMIEIKAS